MTQEKSKETPATGQVKPEREPRPTHATPAPQPALDEKGKAVAALLEQSLASFTPKLGGSGDAPVAEVQPGQVPAVCRICKEDPRLDFKLLHCLSVVDYKDYLQVVYHLYSINKNHKAVIKANVPADNPRIPTVSTVWRGADWYEREGHDLFGVTFEGHPDLKPLLLYEGFEGYPGRKSFPFNDYQEW